jgi:hypothetical protein
MIRVNGKLAITPGEWGYCGKNYVESVSGDHVADTTWSNECQANAELIAEAGTVTNETGRTPAELRDLCRELRIALQRLHWKCSSAERPDHAERLASETAIAKSEGV